MVDIEGFINYEKIRDGDRVADDYAVVLPTFVNSGDEVTKNNVYLYTTLGVAGTLRVLGSIYNYGGKLIYEEGAKVIIYGINSYSFEELLNMLKG